MWLFKKKVIKEIHDGTWGHLASVHNTNVDTIDRELRCVEREGVLEDGKRVTFQRIFKLSEVKQKGIIVTGWETFDQYPELILYEGYLNGSNEAHLERKKE